jgi:hypothetical protein
MWTFSGKHPMVNSFTIEFQSTNDPAMPLRMAEHPLRIYRRYGTRQTVLYAGVDPLRMQTEVTGPQFGFEYRLVDIREMDGDRLPGRTCYASG